MNLPAVLDPELLDAESDRGNFLRTHLLRLGEAAKSDAIFEENVIAAAKAAIPPPLAEAWRGIVAREMLLAAQWTDPARVKAGATALENATRPFGEGNPTLVELLGLPVAAALVPLLVPGGKGSPAQVWLVQARPKSEPNFAHYGLKSPAYLKLSPNLGFHWVQGSDRAEVDGQSWELAAALASNALAREDRAAAVRRLAGGWIVTGEIHAENRVSYVAIGNKPELAAGVTGRGWLLPEENADSITPAFERASRGRLRFANTLEQAVATVFEDERTLIDRPEKWSQGIDTLHMFTTPLLGALVASAIWSKPKTIVVWTSKGVERLKSVLMPVLEELKKTMGWEIEPRDVDDERVEKVEEDLLSHGTLNGEEKCEGLLFNVTGGTLLMRIAAVHVARLNPALRLVYRAEQLGRKVADSNFTRIRYTGYRARTAVLETDLKGGEEKHGTALLDVHFGDFLKLPDAQAEARRAGEFERLKAAANRCCHQVT